MYSDLNDIELLNLMKADDEQAFTEIYDRYWQKLYVVALNRLEVAAESKELIQDIFYQLWKRRKTLQLTYSLSTYLATAVKYGVLNHFAAVKRRRAYEQYAIDSLPAIASEQTQEALDFSALEYQLAALVKELPDKCRQVYQLSRDEGYSQKEISKELNIAEKTVEAHLGSALKKLRKGLVLFWNLTLFFIFFDQH